MDSKLRKYYLACGFLYKAYYHCYDHVEDTEIEYIQVLLERQENKLNGVAWWLLDEMKRGGSNFVIDSKQETVNACISLYTEKFHNFSNYLSDVSQQVNLKNDLNIYYLCYLSCAWLKCVIKVFEQYVESSEIESIYGNFLEIKPDFIDSIICLEDQLKSISQNYFPQGKIEILNKRMEETNQKLTKDWLQLIEEASSKLSLDS